MVEHVHESGLQDRLVGCFPALDTEVDQASLSCTEAGGAGLQGSVLGLSDESLEVERARVVGWPVRVLWR